jgi:hypothetical protein
VEDFCGVDPVCTHELEFDGAHVVKRYRSWDRGEPRREWRALGLLARYAPGLAPEPVRADLEGEPPSVVMSRLPGEPLGAGPVTPDQLDAIAEAVERLHTAVPARVLDSVGPVSLPPPAALARVRAMAALRGVPRDPHMSRALESARAWLDSGWVEQDARGSERAVVFGQSDGNLANFLADGGRVALVDYEDSGRSDRAFEPAAFVEHLSVRACGGIRAEPFLSRFGLTAAERERVRGLRRLFGCFRLVMLLPGGPSRRRNPPGTAERQATRLLDLLG